MNDSPPKTPPPDDWFAEAFGALYPLIYAHRSESQARKEVQFALRVMKPDAGLPLLDCGCGAGRHLQWLAKDFCGISVGLDYSVPLLCNAREKIGHDIHLLRGDMRRLPFPDRTFGCVCSFFTSFGYFPDDENEKAVAEWARVLKPDGVLFLDFLNAEHVRGTLVPESRRVIGRWSIQERRWIDHRRHRVNKQITVTDSQGNCREFYESVRLYEPDELTALLASRGLRETGRFGDYGGTPWSNRSDRLIILARRTRS
ncbi:MAG TPA: class I SAM-dependent methyltransferase [Candidatus Hydrogenedentes bacterium]|nr:class I SAM-dependent methyltransferase [Candidatus Hydrogenedentota bacterium]